MGKKSKKVLLTVPDLTDQGGVANFYNAMLPYLKDNLAIYEVGKAKGRAAFLHPLVDQAAFKKLFLRVQPSLVHINPSLNFKSFIRDGLLVKQAKSYNCPILLFWHGWNKSFEHKVERSLLWFFKRTFAQADVFIVLASEFKDKLRKWGVTAPIYVETTTVDTHLIDEFELDKKIHSFRDIKTIKILFLARLEKAKGVFETVQAVKLLLNKNIPVSLTIAGDGAVRKELEIFVSSLGFSDNQIQFTGDIRGQDKIQAFTDHHLYCLPTYGEGLPVSVLEAMLFGLPVVTCPVGGLADVFLDGKMGRLAQTTNPEEIALCLENLIKNKDKMSEISIFNNCYAKKHFIAPVVAARLQEIYAKMFCDL